MIRGLTRVDVSEGFPVPDMIIAAICITEASRLSPTTEGFRDAGAYDSSVAAGRRRTLLDGSVDSRRLRSATNASNRAHTRRANREDVMACRFRGFVRRYSGQRPPRRPRLRAPLTLVAIERGSGLAQFACVQRAIYVCRRRCSDKPRPDLAGPLMPIPKRSSEHYQCWLARLF
jgi:hypothetical protein